MGGFLSINLINLEKCVIRTESMSFRHWVVSAGSFRPESGRPIFGVGRFGLGRWLYIST